ncbi:MAG: hypothetical protein LBV34_03280 [Nocardiopsaceae bacterium]|nr:hypothetical protein [Nocardiopsaceae bacterium]
MRLVLPAHRTGQDLKAVCDAMGQWGARWLEIEPHHKDPAYVLWATAKLVNPEVLPDRTVVVRFELTDRPGDNYWLLLRKPTPELCTKGTGYVEDVIARTDAACLIDIHLRRISYQEARQAGKLSLDGPRQVTDALMTWIQPSPYSAADLARRARLLATPQARLSSQLSCRSEYSPPLASRSAGVPSSITSP